MGDGLARTKDLFKMDEDDLRRSIWERALAFVEIIGSEYGENRKIMMRGTETNIFILDSNWTDGTIFGILGLKP